MARTVKFATVPPTERDARVEAAWSLYETVFRPNLGGLFSSIPGTHSPNEVPPASEIREVLALSKRDPFVGILIKNALLACMANTRMPTLAGIRAALHHHATIIKQLPQSGGPYEVYHSDARTLPLPDQAADLVITSPPYVNVFNYHQNFRYCLELMGWDMLDVAKSEFGSNRKHRGNRFLTVIQYARDMQGALKELHRVLRPAGRAIIVVGRESSVRGVSFMNGRIVAALATSAGGFELASRQERKFKTKFGESIYEDILHLTPSARFHSDPGGSAVAIAIQALREAIPKAPTKDAQRDVLEAIAGADEVLPSPIWQPPFSAP